MFLVIFVGPRQTSGQGVGSDDENAKRGQGSRVVLETARIGQTTPKYFRHREERCSVDGGGDTKTGQLVSHKTDVAGAGRAYSSVVQAAARMGRYTQRAKDRLSQVGQKRRTR